MPKAFNSIDEKPEGVFKNELPSNLSVVDDKPKSIIDDSAIEGYETVNSVLTVGAWMGSPFITYTVAGTATFTQPKGGRAG